MARIMKVPYYYWKIWVSGKKTFNTTETVALTDMLKKALCHFNGTFFPNWGLFWSECLVFILKTLKLLRFSCNDRIWRYRLISVSDISSWTISGILEYRYKSQYLTPRARRVGCVVCDLTCGRGFILPKATCSKRSTAPSPQGRDGWSPSASTSEVTNRKTQFRKTQFCYWEPVEVQPKADSTARGGRERLHVKRNASASCPVSEILIISVLTRPVVL